MPAPGEWSSCGRLRHEPAGRRDEPVCIRVDSNLPGLLSEMDQVPCVLQTIVEIVYKHVQWRGNGTMIQLLARRRALCVAARILTRACHGPRAAGFRQGRLGRLCPIDTGQQSHLTSTHCTTLHRCYRFAATPYAKDLGRPLRRRPPRPLGARRSAMSAYVHTTPAGVPQTSEVIFFFAGTGGVGPLQPRCCCRLRHQFYIAIIPHLLCPICCSLSRTTGPLLPFPATPHQHARSFRRDVCINNSTS